MKSDKKAIEEFDEIILEEAKKRCFASQTAGIFWDGFGGEDKKNEWINNVLLDRTFMNLLHLKTRREAVEEAFKAIEIDLLGNGDHTEFELGYDRAIDEIEQKKKEFLNNK